MANLNDCSFIGNLVAEPEMRYTSGGDAVTNFKIAVNGYKEGDVLFLPVKAWKKTAETCAEYLKKGSKVYVKGRLDISEYEKEGEKKYFTSLNLNQVEFLTPKEG